MSQENVEIVREGWDAWLRGDLRGLLRQLDPDVVWDTSHFRDWPEAAYYGLSGVKRFLNEWLEVWDDYETVSRTSSPSRTIAF
jgi:ketosteroid isomerase-like protein